MAVFDDKKGISVADGFKLQAEKPLDARQQVDTYDQLAELVSGNGAWEGMMVYVVGVKKTYQYNGASWVAMDANSHTHSNKTVLDGITSAKVSDWDSADGRLDSIEDNLSTLANKCTFNATVTYNSNPGGEYEETSYGYVKAAMSGVWQDETNVEINDIDYEEVSNNLGSRIYITFTSNTTAKATLVFASESYSDPYSGANGDTYIDIGAPLSDTTFDKSCTYNGYSSLADLTNELKKKANKTDTFLGSGASGAGGYGGAAIGTSATSTWGGGAVGGYAGTTTGGAVGYGASSEWGAAMGYQAKTGYGAAIGNMTSSDKGGAIGCGAATSNGFAGGWNAITKDSDGDYIDAVQLGTGTNNNEKTLQVYSYQLMDVEGHIPIDRIADGTVTTAKLAGEVNDSLDSKLESQVVSALPSNSLLYDFTDGETHFSPISRMSAAVTDGVNGITVTSAGSSQTARGYISILKATQGSCDSVSIEFDTTINATTDGTDTGAAQRMVVGLVNSARMNSTSISGSGFGTTGTIFYHGIQLDGAYSVNGSGGNGTINSFLGKTVHTKVVIDFSTGTYSYALTASSGTQSASNVAFLDKTVTDVAAIEFYSWASNSTAQIDNIAVTARTDAKENTRYLIPNGIGGYDEYQYVDGEAVKLSGDVATAELADGAVTMKKLDADLQYTNQEIGVQLYKWWDTDDICSLSEIAPDSQFYDFSRFHDYQGWFWIYVDEEPNYIDGKLMYNDSVGYTTTKTLRKGNYCLCTVISLPKYDVDTSTDGAIDVNFVFGNNAVANENIVDEAVTTAKLADATVTTAKLADGAVTAAELSEAVKSAPIYFGTCDTAEGTAAKAVTVDGFTLTHGACVFVRFTNAVKAPTTATEITLDVNGTGATRVTINGIDGIGNHTSSDGTLEGEYQINAGDTIIRSSGLALCVYHNEDDNEFWAVNTFEPYAAQYAEKAYDGTDLNLLGERLNYFGTCSTAKGTAAKTVSITPTPNLIDGMRITVRFANGLIALGSSNAITLNLNDTGALPVYINGIDNISDVYSSGAVVTDANGCLSFIYHAETSTEMAYWTLDAPAAVWGAECVIGSQVIDKSHFVDDALNLDVYDTLPTATEANRGKMILRTIDDVDYVYVCRKNGTAYEWIDITGAASINS